MLDLLDRRDDPCRVNKAVLEPSSLQSEPMPSYRHCLTNIQEGVFDEKSIKPQRKESNAAGMFYRMG